MFILMERENMNKEVKVEGITIHFRTEDTPEGYVESCQIKYASPIGIENIASIYRSIVRFYEGDIKKNE